MAGRMLVLVSLQSLQVACFIFYYIPLPCGSRSTPGGTRSALQVLQIQRQWSPVPSDLNEPTHSPSDTEAP